MVTSKKTTKTTKSKKSSPTKEELTAVVTKINKDIKAWNEKNKELLAEAKRLKRFKNRDSKAFKTRLIKLVTEKDAQDKKKEEILAYAKKYKITIPK